MAKFEVVGDIEKNGRTFTVLKGIRGTVFSPRDAEKKFKDLDGEFFHEATFFGDEYGITRKFLLYDHGSQGDLDEFAIPNPLIGAIELKSKDATARWFEAELDKGNEMYPAIMELNNLGLLGVSSRTLPGKGICIKSDDGAIDNWPEVELSFTVMPADPRTRFSDEEIVTLKSVFTKYLPRLEKVVPQGETGVDGQKNESGMSTGPTGPTGPVGDLGVEGEKPQKDASLYMSIEADLDPASVGGIVESVTGAAVSTEEATGPDAIIARLMDLIEEAINPWKSVVEQQKVVVEQQKTQIEDLTKQVKALDDQRIDHEKSIRKIAQTFRQSLRENINNLPTTVKNKLIDELGDSKSQTPPPDPAPSIFSRPAPRGAFGAGAPGSN